MQTKQTNIQGWIQAPSCICWCCNLCLFTCHGDIRRLTQGVTIRLFLVSWLPTKLSPKVTGGNLYIQSDTCVVTGSLIWTGSRALALLINQARRKTRWRLYGLFWCYPGRKLDQGGVGWSLVYSVARWHERRYRCCTWHSSTTPCTYDALAE